MAVKINSKTGLTDQEELFVAGMLNGDIPTEAARKAGFSYPNRAASKIMARPRIQQALLDAKIEKKFEQEEDIDASWVLKQSVEVYNISMARKPVMVNDPVKKKKVQLIDKDGSHVWQHDAATSIKALTLVGNHISVKAFADKAVTTSEGGEEENEIDYSLLTSEELEKLAEYEKLIAKAVKKK